MEPSERARRGEAFILRHRTPPLLTATFSAGGVYTLRLTATADIRSGQDDVVITVNQAPVVNAGPAPAIALSDPANLNGSATDDGFPNPPGALTYGWTAVSGPGTVTFADANAASTTATFSSAGSYTLRLTASDSALSGSADLPVLVGGPLPSPWSDQDIGAVGRKGGDHFLQALSSNAALALTLEVRPTRSTTFISHSTAMEKSLRALRLRKTAILQPRLE